MNVKKDISIIYFYVIMIYVDCVKKNYISFLYKIMGYSKTIITERQLWISNNKK